jgi:hypothetical protein
MSQSTIHFAYDSDCGMNVVTAIARVKECRAAVQASLPFSTSAWQLYLRISIINCMNRLDAVLKNSAAKQNKYFSTAHVCTGAMNPVQRQQRPDHLLYLTHCYQQTALVSARGVTAATMVVEANDTKEALTDRLVPDVTILFITEASTSGPCMPPAQHCSTRQNTALMALS